jgi:glycosyltransferase involved in cell wall biosynthesis
MSLSMTPAIHSGERQKIPKVSLGLPVYNGERYLAEAIRALLAQTYVDFELVICDNASTDATGKICRSFVEQDTRVRYFRNETNVGLPRNYRCVFQLSCGQYFKWVAHDDLHAPEFVAKCVEVLEFDPGVILCYTRERVIDEFGKPVLERSYGLDTSLARPDERFRKILWIDLGSPPIFGLMRREILQRTPLLGFSYASDQVLLAQLSLYGRFHEVPEALLLHREHPHRSVLVNRTKHALAAWLDPAKAGHLIFPSWRLFADYLVALLHSPVSQQERLCCAWEMLRWVRYRWKDMLGDLTYAVREFSLRPFHR